MCEQAKQRLELGTGIAGLVAKHLEPVKIDDAYTTPEFDLEVSSVHTTLLKMMWVGIGRSSEWFQRAEHCGMSIEMPTEWAHGRS